MYSAIARAVVRGMDSDWVRDIYGIALIPDAIFYLRISSVSDLVHRLLSGGHSFDYWESGMDMRLGSDLYESFVNYQTSLMTAYEQMIGEYNLQVIDAALPVEQIVEQIKYKIMPLLPHG